MTARLTDKELDRLDELLSMLGDELWGYSDATRQLLADRAITYVMHGPRGRFIAESRNALPALIAAARNEAVLRDVLREARSILAILDHPTKSVTYLDSDRLRGAIDRARDIES